MLPSAGALYESTREFLNACNLPVDRPSARRYTGRIPSLNGVTVLFQRTADIASKVEDGRADLGVTGLDRFLEYRREAGGAAILIEDLGFGRCKLCLAAPSAWLDVTAMSDLADLALEFRQRGRQLRIATKYPRLVNRYLLKNGINHFRLVMATGAIEATVGTGFADLVADITSSGETLRENRLRPLEDGCILTSQACLIGNRATIGRSPAALGRVRDLLEMMSGHLQAKSHYRLSANIRAGSPEELAAKALKQPNLAGVRGPTVSKVYNVDGEGWYDVSLIVAQDNLLQVVDHLRGIGATEISTTRLGYMFRERCFPYEALLAKLEG